MARRFNWGIPNFCQVPLLKSAPANRRTRSGRRTRAQRTVASLNGRLRRTAEDDGRAPDKLVALVVSC